MRNHITCIFLKFDKNPLLVTNQDVLSFLDGSVTYYPFYLSDRHNFLGGGGGGETINHCFIEQWAVIKQKVSIT